MKRKRDSGDLSPYIPTICTTHCPSYLNIITMCRQLLHCRYATVGRSYRKESGLTHPLISYVEFRFLDTAIIALSSEETVGLSKCSPLHRYSIMLNDGQLAEDIRGRGDVKLFCGLGQFLLGVSSGNGLYCPLAHST